MTKSKDVFALNYSTNFTKLWITQFCIRNSISLVKWQNNLVGLVIIWSMCTTEPETCENTTIVFRNRFHLSSNEKIIRANTPRNRGQYSHSTDEIFQHWAPFLNTMFSKQNALAENFFVVFLTVCKLLCSNTNICKIDWQWFERHIDLTSSINFRPDYLYLI